VVALEADGRHLMTDVWTTLGVVAGLAVVRITGVQELDAVIAALIALNIVRTAIELLRESVDGLLDRALPEADQTRLRTVIQGALEPGAAFHALRTRKAGARRFVDFHLLMPGELSIQHAHDLTERIEHAVSESFPNAETTVHIEPIELPGAWRDHALVDLEPSVDPDDLLLTASR